ncbi:serine/threonine-protein kinase [Nocardia sp. NPDC050789]
MGEVYRARHPRLPRQVAIKVLTDVAARDASFRLRFDREGALAARVNHRNLVTVYDRGVEGDRPWICMEYVPGHDVSTLVRRGPLAVEQAVYIVGQAALGIDHAHRQDLLHRDIKPANILVAPRRSLRHRPRTVRRRNRSPRLPPPGPVSTASAVRPTTVRDDHRANTPGDPSDPTTRPTEGHRRAASSYTPPHPAQQRNPRKRKSRR